MIKVGVVGAGVIGVGVIQDLAQHGHSVIAVDLTDELLDAARAVIRQNLRMHAMLGRSAGEKPAAVLDRISFTTDVEVLADVDFVIENVTEKWDVKEAVYRRIDSICPEPTVFGVNTSCISITRVGSVTERPDRVVGMHFMNPVPLKSMVEVIRGYHTSDETLEKVNELLASCDKECVVVNDMPGFVSNRVLMVTVNEAIFVLADQVASAQDVDRIFKTCFSHKMGPLETADLIGLDTILFSLEALCEAYSDNKFRPCPLLKNMVHAGLLGRKSGRGFYSYEE